MTVNDNLIFTGRMKLPFSNDNAKMLIDACTGGEKIHRIVLEDIMCSKVTGSGLFETLADLDFAEEGLQEIILNYWTDETMFPLYGPLISGLAQQCYKLQKLHVTDMYNLANSARKDLA